MSLKTSFRPFVFGLFISEKIDFIRIIDLVQCGEYR